MKTIGKYVSSVDDGNGCDHISYTIGICQTTIQTDPDSIINS